MGYLTTALQGRALCPSATNVNGLTIYLPFGLRTGPNHPYPPLQIMAHPIYLGGSFLIL